MRSSLFLKIFVGFWATAILTGLALVVTYALQQSSPPEFFHRQLQGAALYTGTVAVDLVQRQGPAAATAYLQTNASADGTHGCLFTPGGAMVAGGDCQALAPVVRRAAVQRRPLFTQLQGHYLVAVHVLGAGRRPFVFVLQSGAAMPGRYPGRGAALRWAVALLVAGGICLLLVRSLTRPVLQLREAARQLAAGNLASRAAPEMEGRRDEFGALVRDFNTMAARLEDLVTGQRRLLQDVSHELRSPLARLAVALDLARDSEEPAAAFAQMERDIERLNGLIAQVLDMARLDATPASFEKAPVDLEAVVRRVAEDTNFEATAANRQVTVTSVEPCRVLGDEALLHSALENVVRNALRYTADGTAVEISLACEEPKQIRLEVRDAGPGLPEGELNRIFLPFYRTEAARSRASGGAGLGLAIAQRVLRLHGGSIEARNRAPQGLAILMRLPRLVE